MWGFRGRFLRLPCLPRLRWPVRLRGPTGRLSFPPGPSAVEPRGIQQQRVEHHGRRDPLPPNCVAPNCVTATGRHLSDRVQQRSGRRLFRHHREDLARPTAADGQSCNRSKCRTARSPASSSQGPAGHQLPVEIRAGAQPLDRRPQPDFMGYVAPVDAIDVSNSNTPVVVDPDQSGAAALLPRGRDGRRARPLPLHPDQRLQRQQRPRRGPEQRHGANVFYTAGNAGNGGNPQPDGVITGAGAQITTAQTSRSSTQPIRACRPRSAASTSPSSA